jgi:hypothetical protein
LTLLKMGSYASLPLSAGVLGDAVGGGLTDFLLVKTGNVKYDHTGCGRLEIDKEPGRHSSAAHLDSLTPEEICITSFRCRSARTRNRLIRSRRRPHWKLS